MKCTIFRHWCTHFHGNKEGTFLSEAVVGMHALQSHMERKNRYIRLPYVALLVNNQGRLVCRSVWVRVPCKEGSIFLWNFRKCPISAPIFLSALGRTLADPILWYTLLPWISKSLESRLFPTFIIGVYHIGFHHEKIA